MWTLARAALALSQAKHLLDCRNGDAPARSLVSMNYLLAEPAAQRLLGRPDCHGSDMCKEHLFMHSRKRFDCIFQRQPFYSLYIVCGLAHRAADSLHMPELYNLDLA